MEATVKDGYLHIKIALKKEPALSKSGKTNTVATSNGFVKTAAQVNEKPVSISINAFIPKD